MSTSTSTVKRVSPHRLSSLARATIQDYGLTVAAYVRHAGWLDGDWHGDRCGCTDDRCIGYHHDEHDDCGCLPVLIEQALGLTAPGHHLPEAGGRAYPNGVCVGVLIATPTGTCAQCGWCRNAEPRAYAPGVTSDTWSLPVASTPLVR